MSRAHDLMYGLIYPAVLGTVLINLFIPLSNLASGQSLAAPEFTISKLILTLGIVFHFIIDYMFAKEAQDHEWQGFYIDILILVGLWIAAAGVNMNMAVSINVRIVCCALAGVYVIFLYYVYEVHEHIKYWQFVATVEIFALIWFIIGAFWGKTTFVVLGLFIFSLLLAVSANMALHKD